MEELYKICNRFKAKKCTLEELYRRLSWIAVPNQYIDLVAEAERNLELVQFTCLEEKWYDEAVTIIDNLLNMVED